MGLGYIERSNARFPAVNNRLFPSITPATAAPGDVIPENGNGLGYFAAPPPGGYRVPGTMAGIGAIVAWPRIQTEWDLIQQEKWDNPTFRYLKASGMKGLADGDMAVLDPDTQVYVTANTTQENLDDYALTTVQRIDQVIPDDNLYAQGALAWAGVLAGYWPQVSQDARVRAAIERLAKRYAYVKANYPGVTILTLNSTLPSGSGARAPILIDYLDGTYAYAPGYGPVSQYGALQVANAAVPLSPRVSAYTGQIVGSANSGDINAPLVGATPGSGTWGGVGPGPGGTTNAPPPPDGYPGPLTTGSVPTGTGTGAENTTGIIPGVSNTMLFAGGGALVLLLAVMGGRR